MRTFLDSGAGELRPQTRAMLTERGGVGSSGTECFIDGGGAADVDVEGTGVDTIT